MLNKLIAIILQDILRSRRYAMHLKCIVCIMCHLHLNKTGKKEKRKEEGVDFVWQAGNNTQAQGLC